MKKPLISKPWRATVQNRDTYLQNSQLTSYPNHRFVHEVLGHEPTAFENAIVIIVREFIAKETNIPIKYVLPDEECKLYADMMGPVTFWSYYLQPLMGLTGFDSMKFLGELEYLFNMRTGKQITLSKSAYQTLSQFDRKNQKVREWILELIEKIRICKLSPDNR
jgi:hypothetical protein